MKYVLTVTANPALDKVLTVDGFRVGSEQLYGHITLSAGGKGVNVCRALKSLKVDCLATGFAGGLSGRYMLTELENEKIPFDFIDIHQEIRTNLTIIDSRTGKITRLLNKGPKIPSSPIALFLKKFQNLIKNSILIVISGSNIPGAGDDFYNKLIAIAHKLHKKVVLDTSGKALSCGIKAKSFMIKPNLNEAEYVLKTSLSSGAKKKEALKKFLDMGIRNVCITLGRQGAIASNGLDFLSVRPPQQNSPNTVGCGDAFTAGFIHSYLKRCDFRECVKNAVAAATASVLNPQPGYLVKRQVEEMAKQVQISIL